MIIGPNHIFVKNQKHKANIKEDIKDIEHEKLIKFGFLVTENKMNWFICNDGLPLEKKPYLMFDGGRVESPSFQDGSRRSMTNGYAKFPILLNQL